MAHNPDIATTRVQVTVDVRVNGSWGRDCSLGQIQDQASAGAINNLRKALEPVDVVIVGEPRVTMVVHVKPDR